MPAATRPRPSDGAESASKKARTDLKASNGESSSSSASSLHIPSAEVVVEYKEQYAAAVPYKYAAISDLIDDSLLEAVVQESHSYGVRGDPSTSSLPGWGWEQKETDIYKIQQTPDLASLDPEHLPDETLAGLPAITRLKDALYSEDFRAFVRQVTGCGALSGKKTDGSVGLYTQGSHLLLHDDSISTRLVSYILYLPNSPSDLDTSSHPSLQPAANGAFTKGWDPAWGGSLELYPVEGDKEVGVPGVKRLGKVDVKWGQIVFFEVQPGRSYHAVEEVIVGDGRQRLGVSGWFHRPIEGEEGYAPLDPSQCNAALSSLAQITSAPSLPLTTYDTPPPPGLKPSDIAFLTPFLAPSYLSAATLEKLSGQFVEASEIVLHNFLRADIAKALKEETEALDNEQYAPTSRLIPPQDLGESTPGWTLQGPSSKHRYLALTSSSSATPTLDRIKSQLLPSSAFRAWLSVVSSLMPTAHRTEARRFRRGLDYTLANGEEASGEVRLDVWLGATWWADVEPGSEEEEALLEDGGWEAYLGAPEEGEDPAVFQSKLAKKAAEADAEGDADEGEGQGQDEQGAKDQTEAEPVQPTNAASSTQAPATSSSTNGNTAVPASSSAHPKSETETDGPKITMNGQELEFDPDQFSDGDFDTDSEAEDEDDGPLLMQGVSFNRLLIVLRDPGVMRFVKYLSAGAKGSRWDIGGEWEVGVMEEDE